MDEDQTKAVSPAPAPASLWSMLRVALYIGAIGYGGPTTLHYLKSLFVDRHRWFTDSDFREALGLAQVLPGSTGVTAVSYFGYRRHGYLGALALPLVFLAPSIAAMLVLSWAYFTFEQLPFVQPLFVGLGALVVALLLNATLSLGAASCTGGTAQVRRGLTIAVVTFAGSFLLRLNVIWLILAAGVLGMVLFGRDAATLPPADEARQSRSTPAPHQLVRRFLPVLVAAAVVVAVLAFPETRTLFLAFFQVGLLAFGGGFASVAVLQHVVVDQMQWLDFHQFRDGIALGQITPGPVLITATFVGYKVNGLAGSLAATLGIFLPPIVLVSLLADLHGRLQRLILVRAMVTGFQCGFVGLVASITIGFALNSLSDWQTWTIFLLGFTYLWWLKKNPAWAIVGTVVFSLLFIPA